ncbi:MAG: hypothetical protein ACTHK7_09525 [Aureliella sp.]
MSSIVSGLSYGSVKALMETWTANREKQKKARQEARQARRGGGLFGRRRRQPPNTVHTDVVKRTGDSEVDAPLVPYVEHDKLSSVLGSDSLEPIDLRHGQIEAVPGIYYRHGRARREARRQRRLDRRG